MSGGESGEMKGDLARKTMLRGTRRRTTEEMKGDRPTKSQAKKDLKTSRPRSRSPSEKMSDRETGDEISPRPTGTLASDIAAHAIIPTVAAVGQQDAQPPRARLLRYPQYNLTWTRAAPAPHSDG